MPNHAINYSWSGPGGGTIGPYAPISTGNTAVDVNPVTVANGAANAINFPAVLFGNASLQSVFMLASGNLSIHVNNITTPSASNQTFSLRANFPFAWNANSGITVPFQANVSNGIFANNTSGANVTFQAEFLFN